MQLDEQILKRAALLVLLASLEDGSVGGSSGADFSAFYEEFMPRVFGYISYRVNDRQTAEDITSTIFEKALAAWGSYDPGKAGKSTWVFAIARNALTDHFRAAAARPSVALDDSMDFADEGCDPEGEALRSDEVRRLRTLIAGLDADERGLIALKFGAGLTNREIARSSGMSESNVGVIIFRTVRKLRAQFEENK